MNIIYFTDTYLPKIDGIAISISQFTEILARKGHRFFICCPSYGHDKYFPSEENIEIHRFPSTGFPSYDDVKMVLPSLPAISSIAKKFEPDVYHIHTPGFLGMAGIEYGRQSGKPVAATYHTLVDQQHEYLSVLKILKLNNLVDAIKAGSPITSRLVEQLTFKKLRDNLTIGARKRFIRTIVNTVYERSDVIISPSHLIKKELLTHNVKKPIEVISNGMDLNAFKGEMRPYPEEAKSDPLNYPWKLLHVGRLSYEKNCNILIEAFCEITNTLPNATFTLVGDGPAVPGLKTMAESMGLADKIKFTGFVPHDDLPTIYPEYDLFWTASTMETQGLVILEALACGVPAVGVRSFAIPELVLDGQNGYLAAPGNWREISRLVTMLLKSPRDYETFSKRALEVASTHEVNNCADRLINLYERMAEDVGAIGR